MRKKDVTEEFYKENSDFVCRPARKWEKVSYQPKGEVRGKCLPCASQGIGIYTSNIAYIKNHVEQHRKGDFIKIYRTRARKWRRTEAHPQGGELYAILNTAGSISECGGFLECRHCRKFKRTYKPHEVDTNAKLVGAIRNHEQCCKQKQK